jgi:hypothetical protein
MEVERPRILKVLAEGRWRINGAGNAAERLELHPNTLWFRMKEFGMTRLTRRAKGARESRLPRIAAPSPPAGSRPPPAV